MNLRSSLFAVFTLLAFGAVSFAVDVFHNQPNIKGAYNKLLNVLTELEKSKQGDAQKHVDQAIIDLGAAKTFLEQSTNNKGTYRPAAMKLCDEAKETLSATPPDVVKATEITNRALHEVNMAGHAGSHR
jgi:hypothetical protein